MFAQRIFPIDCEIAELVCVNVSMYIRVCVYTYVTKLAGGSTFVGTQKSIAPL